MEAYMLRLQLASCLSRRQILRAAAAVTAGLLPLLAAAQLKAATSGLSLAEFMALSRWLTEVPDLSAELGRLYLDSLQRGAPGDSGLDALLDDPGFRTGAPPKGAKPVAGTSLTVLKLWYTGLYDAPDGRPAVAGYIDTLAWRAVGYTAAPSECKGATNQWADPPD
jgi:Membrane bound FAD containing D-sorbitol dehydrogenase